ncbi:AraC family transcriptional regulator ligand-binding domain-containing protein [Phaeobacter sp. C3_T13_0]|uniref:AraC family transcriptional regulator n=1 Tax=Phaeobacter cretensis TaxID=3342641 RepID=UPI0039BD047F
MKAGFEEMVEVCKCRYLRVADVPQVHTCVALLQVPEPDTPQTNLTFGLATTCYPQATKDCLAWLSHTGYCCLKHKTRLGYRALQSGWNIGMTENNASSDSQIWNVPGFGVHHIAKLLDNCGADIVALLRSANLPIDIHETPPNFVDVRNELRLLELAIQETGDQLFAISAGKTFNPRKTTLLSYVVLNSPTVGNAIEKAVNYARLARGFAKLSFYEEGDGMFLEIDSMAELMRADGAHSEFRTSALLTSLQIAAETPLPTHEIRFRHKLSEEMLAQISDALSVKIKQSQRVPGILFDKKILDIPIRDADPALLLHLETHVEGLMSALTPEVGETSSLVQSEITSRLSFNAPTQDDVAKVLGMSISTLGRKLAKEGTTYKQLLKDIRKRLAEQYLDDAKLTLSDIAFALGYSDQAAFSNAYKTWTGRSPGSVRTA